MERAVGLVAQAARKGSQMLVFPEAWLPGYPVFVWRLMPEAEMDATDRLFALSQANSVDLSKGELSPLQDAAREYGVVLVVGIQEVDSAVSGSTLYNSSAIVDVDGRIVNVHRKLMPTNPERMVWGYGDASGLRVVDTAVGRLGVLHCWENYMPLARYALYAQNLDIHIAPTWDFGEVWQATLRHIAREGGCWVVGAATALEARDIPADLPYRERLFPDPDEWVNPGEAVIYGPSGVLHAGPMRARKGLLDAEIDPAAARASRRRFDVSGHFSRPDIFSLKVKRNRLPPVAFD